MGSNNSSENEGEDDTSVGVQVALIIIIFVAGLLGGLAPKCLSACPTKWVQLFNAFAGGLIIGVALCHMIAESSEGVEPWGRAISCAFGNDACCGEEEDEHEHDEAGGNCTNTTIVSRRLHGGEEGECEPYPIGMALVCLGFFFMLFIEELFPHEHVENNPHASDDEASSEDEGRKNTKRKALTKVSSDDEASSDDEGSLSSGSSVGKNTKGKRSSAAGCGTWLGLMIHSTIEGFAIGGVGDPVVMASIAFHKFFAVFAASSTLMSCHSCCWFTAVLVLALSGPVAAVIGMVVSESLGERPICSALQCFAAGTLLSVGIFDLLAPALHDSHEWTRRKVAFAAIGALTMVVIAIWA